MSLGLLLEHEASTDAKIMEPSPELAQYRDSCGHIRLDNIRGSINLNDHQQQTILTEAYADWVLDDVYLAFERQTTKTVVRTGSQTMERKYRVLKGRKRGNDVDTNRVEGQIRQIHDAVLEFCQEVRPGHAPTSTRAVYVTCTVDPRIVDGDISQAWAVIAREFNKFLSHLRKRFSTTIATVQEDGKFGCRVELAKIGVVRSWESHESGMPHIHAILTFPDFEFGILRDAKQVWRIKEREDFRDAWKLGFIDIQAITRGTSERAVANTLWYITKSSTDMDYRLVHDWPRKRKLTQAILWYLRMRSYSISRFLRDMGDDVASARLDCGLCITQTDLEGLRAIETDEVWIFLGLVHRSDTDIDRNTWEDWYDEPPDWMESVFRPFGSKRCAWAGGWDN